MFACPSRRRTRPRTTTRLHRVAAALAAVAGGLLAWAAAAPAASAATMLIPDPGAGGAYGPVLATPTAPVRVIAAGAALAAATAAVFLDRTRTSHRAASATG